MFGKKRIVEEERGYFKKNYTLDQSVEKVPLGVLVKNNVPMYWDLRRNAHFFLAGTGGGGKDYIERYVLEHIMDHTDSFDTVAIDVLGTNYKSLRQPLSLVIDNTNEVFAKDGIYASLQNIANYRGELVQKYAKNNIFEVQKALCKYYEVECNGQKEKFPFDKIFLTREDNEPQSCLEPSYIYRSVTINQLCRAEGLEVYFNNEWRSDLVVTEAGEDVYKPKDIMILISHPINRSGASMTGSVLPPEILVDGLKLGMHYMMVSNSNYSLVPEPVRNLFDLKMFITPGYMPSITVMREFFGVDIDGISSEPSVLGAGMVKDHSKIRLFNSFNDKPNVFMYKSYE